MKRASGILLPVFSLPSKYGIGCFSKEAYQWIDQLKEAGQSYWQILPLTPTTYGDSPYQSYSSFAGNPYFIDLEVLIEEGVLTKEECEEADFGDNANYVEYEKLNENRFELLRKAYERSNIGENPEYHKFVSENAYWLDDYALFMAVKLRFEGKGWSEWAEDIRKRWANALDYYRRECYFDIEFYKYLQFKFNEQWMKLKAYANANEIELIGDIPIYVAADSADAWASPELFQFDNEYKPVAVAGCPPDAFSATGQLWGNPLYRWDYHKQTGYDWWCKRIEHCFKLYDVVRIDHFRGFESYYCVPYGAETAVNGHWEKGPGIDLFNTINQKLGSKQIIAEDLGTITEEVVKLLRDSGYPGMKIIEFAFDPREASDYLPHKYDRNSVVYTGTHDNETLVQWYKGLDVASKAFAEEYMNNKRTPAKEKYWDFIRLAMMSTSNTCVTPVQDFMGLGSEARINHPSTVGTNWKWRMNPEMLSAELIEKIYELTRISWRLTDTMRIAERAKTEEKIAALREEAEKAEKEKAEKEQAKKATKAKKSTKKKTEKVEEIATEE